MTNHLRRYLSLFVATVILLGLQIGLPTNSADAADASQFQAGNIISDAIFFDGTAINSDEVQSFLSSKVSNCTAGYTCLKDYRQNTPTMPASAGRCNQYDGAANETAAQIIAKVGAACGINPRVLIVLLEKEQSLVTSSSPSSSRYSNATGFACPDTAPCDPAYAGFFYQVYSAARQFKNYGLYPGSFNYHAGQWNNILYSPNSSCGSSPIYIENQATANLYIYTPYQPNAAALSNLYGTGDGCSAYGNRNFWRIFTDWFGSTQAGLLFRSTNNPSVFVISNNVKHAVPDLLTFSAYTPAGGLSFVSDAYIASIPSGGVAKRIIRNETGGIFLIDAGMKLAFTTCAQVYAYGGSCDATGYVQLTNQQAGNYVNGPTVDQILGTTEGPTYFPALGVKREIAGSQAAAANSLPWPASRVLTSGALSSLPLGQPVVANNTIIKSRQSGQAYLVSDSKKYLLSASILGYVGEVSNYLTNESLSLIPDGAASDGSLVAPDGRVAVVGSKGLILVDNATLISNLHPLPISQELFNSKLVPGFEGSALFVKTTDSPTIYLLNNGQLKPIDSWNSIVGLQGTSSPSWITVSPTAIAGIPTGAAPLVPGRMYRSSSSPAVYLVNGYQQKVPIPSFKVTDAIGFVGFTVAPAGALEALTTGSPLTYGIKCGSTYFVGAGGRLSPIPSGVESLYPITFTDLESSMCNIPPRGPLAGRIVREPTGGIYYLENGTKRHIPTWAKFDQLVNGGGWLNIESDLAASIPSGAPM
jgi:hypothetical protein